MEYTFLKMFRMERLLGNYMKKNICCIVSENDDAYYNMALEDYIFQTAKQSVLNEINILLLWQNKNAVIVGKNQDVKSECNQIAMEEKGVQLVRRKTGGGAVYHDMGNLNFSFIQSIDYADVEKNIAIIINALGDLGISARKSGRNDIFVDDKKISGNAFYRSGNVSIHHGTMLVDLNVQYMKKFLLAKGKAYYTEKIPSHDARVVNLSEILPGLTVEQVKAKLLRCFEKIYNVKVDEVITDTRYVGNDKRFEDIYQMYRSDSWTYGSKTSYNKVLEGIYSWGKVRIELYLQDSTIKTIKIWTDAMEGEEVLCIEKKVEKCTIDEVRNMRINGYVSKLESDVLELIING